MIICADSLSLPLDDCSVDTICCDGPYGLGFMGKAWDHGVPGEPYWAEALRVAKPGCWLMAFGGTRTYHRLAVATEDAGWEIRDCLMWLYGSGFPKSTAIGKAIDRAAGVERAVVGRRRRAAGSKYAHVYEKFRDLEFNITAPATESAARWEGYGTSLKPAFEPIILAQKPRDGTFANNALTHGCGALWIDGARIGASNTTRPSGINVGIYGDDNRRGMIRGSQSGRWPANLILDPAAAAMLDEQSGELHTHSTGGNSPSAYPSKGVTGWRSSGGPYTGDSGGASRFFYVAKPSKHERNAGLSGEGKKRDESRNADQPSMHGGNGNPYNRGAAPMRNHHPTVKPVALLRHLLRLTRPPDGGTVLDNFCGSGSTGIAAVLEGRRFIGVDISEEYCAIARARIKHAEECPWDYDPELEKPPEVDPRQQDLFGMEEA